MSDIFSIFAWWLTFFSIGLLFFPLSSQIFSWFYDRGYIFSKVLGVIFISYIAFTLGTLHVLPFSTPTLFLIAIIAGAVNWFYLRKKVLKLLDRRQFFILVIEECIFVIGLVFWAFIRAHDPSINGLEKFMDFGFMNSIDKSTFFPPQDMWFPPHSINYYYFGHLVTTVLSKLSLLPLFISYNLMLATIFALTLSCSFSIGLNFIYLITKKIKKSAILLGILAAILVTFSGNLHTLYSFFNAYPNEKPVAPWTLKFAPESFPNNYWYPNATRFIPYTIHEFPMYSYVVADLHGHVLSIPFVLLTIALILQTFISIANPTVEKAAKKRKNVFSSYYYKFLSFMNLSQSEFLRFVLIGFVIAVLYMTNAWDGPIYFMLAGLTLTAAFILKKTNWLIRTISAALITLVSFVVFSLPFSLNFKPFVSGFGFNCSPEFLIKLEKFGPILFQQDRCQRSEVYQWFILWGFFVFFALLFIIIKFFRRKMKDHFNTMDIFVFCMIALSLFLLIIPEFFYAADIYPTHFRANTMFKLGYQAFIMMSLTSAYIIMRITKHFKLWPFLFIFLPLISLVLVYPYFAMFSYYGNGTGGLKEYQGLDGLQYLSKSRPDDYKTIQWMNKKIKGQPVILEAQGDSYTDYARLSANTGFPTVLGWTVHEWLWRGSYDVPAPRIDEIKRMYESLEIAETKQLLNQYDVKYVYVGDLEREKYPALFEDKFITLGTVVFESGNSRLYKLR